LDYQEIIERRRALTIEPYKSLAEVGFEGPWVTPYQITSNSFDGPVLVALHWLDESSILTDRALLQNLGYLPNIRFNTVIDAALARQGLSRSDTYVTQTFHLIPRTRSERISQAAIRRSFDEVTRFELQGRKVIAPGDIAAGECAWHNIEHIAVCHPSRRGYTNGGNATAPDCAVTRGTIHQFDELYGLTPGVVHSDDLSVLIRTLRDEQAMGAERRRDGTCGVYCSLSSQPARTYQREKCERNRRRVRGAVKDTGTQCDR
jgi:hypothetical protein